MPDHSSQQEVDINSFLAKTGVENVISDIEKGLANKPGGRPVYSDLYKEEEGKVYEYVDYVQEGGGVLGVALVGYTYVLERLGFRFLKLAGTSAGAINTLLMASVQPKNYKDASGKEKYKYQSEIILDEMLRFNLWDLVDGHWFAKRLIRIFIKKNTSYTRLKGFIGFCMIASILYAITLGMLRMYQFGLTREFIDSSVYPYLLGAGAVAAIILTIQIIAEKIKKGPKEKSTPDSTALTPPVQIKEWKKAFWVVVFFLAVPFVLHGFYYYGIAEGLMREGFISSTIQDIIRIVFHAVGAIAVVGLVLILVATFYFSGRFKRANFGINPGSRFQLWMMDIMKRNQTETTEKLEKVMHARINDQSLKLRVDPNDKERNTKINSPYMSIMASDVTTQTKAEFPKNAKDYWEKCELVNPAEYVRASMSIPVFFAPHRVMVENKTQESSKLWQTKATKADRLTTDKKEVWFVDGGVLSNFPINIFHNPAIRVARMPTFGVKLEDEEHIDAEAEYKPSTIKFMNFLGSIFSTIRFYYDKDFLKRNALYEKAIAHIDVEKINWLNFGMDEETKIDLFKRGAEAAKVFFLGGTYPIDGKMHDSKKFAKDDKIGEAFADGFNWEKFKQFRLEAIEEDMKMRSEAMPSSNTVKTKKDFQSEHPEEKDITV